MLVHTVFYCFTTQPTHLEWFLPITMWKGLQLEQFSCFCCECPWGTFVGHVQPALSMDPRCSQAQGDTSKPLINFKPTENHICFPHSSQWHLRSNREKKDVLQASRGRTLLEGGALVLPAASTHPLPPYTPFREWRPNQSHQHCQARTALNANEMPSLAFRSFCSGQVKISFKGFLKVVIIFHSPENMCYIDDRF